MASLLEDFVDTCACAFLFVEACVHIAFFVGLARIHTFESQLQIRDKQCGNLEATLNSQIIRKDMEILQLKEALQAERVKIAVNTAETRQDEANLQAAEDRNTALTAENSQLQADLTARQIVVNSLEADKARVEEQFKRFRGDADIKIARVLDEVKLVRESMTHRLADIDEIKKQLADAKTEIHDQDAKMGAEKELNDHQAGRLIKYEREKTHLSGDVSKLRSENAKLTEANEKMDLQLAKACARELLDTKTIEEQKSCVEALIVTNTAIEWYLCEFENGTRIRGGRGLGVQSGGEPEARSSSPVILDDNDSDVIEFFIKDQRNTASVECEIWKTEVLRSREALAKKDEEIKRQEIHLIVLNCQVAGLKKQLERRFGRNVGNENIFVKLGGICTNSLEHRS